MITMILVFLGIVVCVRFSGFFSGSEMSFLSYNKIRMENEAEKGNKAAKQLLKLEERHDDTISAILIGNNLVNTAASSLTTIFMLLITGSDKYDFIGTLLITIAVIVFGETIPKIVSKKFANRDALHMAPIISVIAVITRPVNFLVVKAVDFLTRGIKEEKDDDEDESVEELQAIIDTAEDEGAIDSDQKELASAAIDFREVSASDVMTARVDVVSIDLDDRREKTIQTCLDCNCSRLPVYRGSIDHIVGVVHLNRLLKAFAEDPDCEIEPLLMEPCYVYKTMKLPQVLETLRKNRQHLAIVTDEYSGTLGVITMEDVLEEIVGEIWDEDDKVEEDVVKVSENVIDVDGDLNIDEFRELIGESEGEFDFESETVGGWITEFLEEFPKEGDHFTYKNIEVTVLEMDERRVVKARIKISPKEEDA